MVALYVIGLLTMIICTFDPWLRIRGTELPTVRGLISWLLICLLWPITLTILVIIAAQEMNKK